VREVFKKTVIASMVLTCSYANALIGEPEGIAVNMISMLTDSELVSYYNLSEYKGKIVDFPSFSKIKEFVINDDRRILIDFSNIDDEEQRQEMHKELGRSLGIGFPNNFLLITRHKDELLFTPVSDENDPNIFLLDGINNRPIRKKRNTYSTNIVNNELKDILNKSFYLSVKKDIDESECTFPIATRWKETIYPDHSDGKRNFCNKPNMNIFYKINLFRSLPFESSGSGIPDAKLVRITLDETSTGAGIHLNNKSDAKSWQSFNPNAGVFANDWIAQFSSDAIAQDYRIEINPSNSKASILKSTPASNINAEFDERIVSSLVIGADVSGDLGSSPKLAGGGKIEYTDTRWLSIKTHDYQIERNSTGNGNISFTWLRQKYATATSLLTRSTDPITSFNVPFNTGVINPIAYGNTPQMDVVYKASPNERGETIFRIDTSVNIRPLYHSVWQYFYGFFGHLVYYGDENTPRNRVNTPAAFTVYWDDAVFLGAHSVNLQLGGFNNKCVQSDLEGRLTTSTCDDKNVSQGFIYDDNGRYRSALNTGLCLDGESLYSGSKTDKLLKCNSGQSQRWKWDNESDQLKNEFTNTMLGHDTLTGALGLYGDDLGGISRKTLTSFMKLFQAGDVYSH